MPILLVTDAEPPEVDDAGSERAGWGVFTRLACGMALLGLTWATSSG